MTIEGEVVVVEKKSVCVEVGSHEVVKVEKKSVCGGVAVNID